jgi:hypothetical protein
MHVLNTRDQQSELRLNAGIYSWRGCWRVREDMRGTVRKDENPYTGKPLRLANDCSISKGVGCFQPFRPAIFGQFCPEYQAPSDFSLCAKIPQLPRVPRPYMPCPDEKKWACRRGNLQARGWSMSCDSCISQTGSWDFSSTFALEIFGYLCPNVFLFPLWMNCCMI